MKKMSWLRLKVWHYLFVSGKEVPFSSDNYSPQEIFKLQKNKHCCSSKTKQKIHTCRCFFYLSIITPYPVFFLHHLPSFVFFFFWCSADVILKSMWPIPTGLNGKTDREWGEKERGKEWERGREGEKKENTKLGG